MEQKLYRNHTLTFRVTDKERDLVREKMKLAGMKNMQHFILKMVLEGRIIRVELDSVNEMVRLLSNATNNINQIAKRANETGSIYASDIEQIRGHYDILWLQTREILKRLSALK